MAHHTIIYGRINGASWRTSDYYRLHRLNEISLKKLPIMDSEYPWINQTMFNIPNKQGVFRDQIITFGASYKTLEYEWHLWLEKFEGILRRLYWRSVTIQAQFEVMGSHEYHWYIDKKETARCLYDEINPIEKWVFESNGPRSFEHIL